jgi:membrane-bound lytic murein transglycosylase D
MAISEYYFPLLKKLLQRDVPLEIKYLAVVESALNPKSSFGNGSHWIVAIHVPNRKIQFKD